MGVRAVIVAASALVMLLPQAPVAGALPDCADTAAHTRLCRTPGHVGITTSPDPALTNRPPGWGYGGWGWSGWGGPGVGLGGGGLWVVF